MDEKLLKPLSCVRLGATVNRDLDQAADRLGMPKATVLRLAVIAGLPLVLRAVPCTSPDQQPQQKAGA